MIEVPFSDFFSAAKKNYNLPATDKVTLEVDKVKIDVKIGNNTNKLILKLENENELIDLFILNINSMISSIITPNARFLESAELEQLSINILRSLDGISTHILKYPEASVSAGQISVKLKPIDTDIFMLDSSSFSSKEKIYSQNATTMKYGRPFSSEFLYDKKIISFLEILVNIDEYEIFKLFFNEVFDIYALLIIEKCKLVIDQFINVECENTIVTFPIDGEYISISPVCSTKVLNEIQYHDMRDPDYNIPNTRINVGGANPQNVADYFSNIAGSQKLLLSKIPYILEDELIKSYKKLYSIKDDFSSLLKSTYYFISEDKKYSSSIKLISSIIFKDDVTFANKESIKDLKIIERLVSESMSNIEAIFQDITTLLNQFDLSKIKYSPVFYYLTDLYNQNNLFKETKTSNELIFNEGIIKYQSITNQTKKDLQNSLIINIIELLEKDFNRINNTTDLFINEDIKTIIQKTINSRLTGEKNDYI